MRPLHPCAEPECPTLVSGAPRCLVHTVTRSEQQAKDPAQAKFYRSARWKTISLMVRREEPFCRECRRNRSQVADHEDGDYTNNARENLRGLCYPCNATITGKQHRAKRRV